MEHWGGGNTGWLAAGPLASVTCSCWQITIMKLCEGIMDMELPDYSETLDSTYTMLEFDSIRVLPTNAGEEQRFIITGSRHCRKNGIIKSGRGHAWTCIPMYSQIYCRDFAIYFIYSYTNPLWSIIVYIHISWWGVTLSYTSIALIDFSRGVMSHFLPFSPLKKKYQDQLI